MSKGQDCDRGILVLLNKYTKSVYKPWIELVYDALEPDDGEEPRGKPWDPGEEEHGESDQALPARKRGRALLHLSALGGDLKKGKEETSEIKN